MCVFHERRHDICRRRAYSQGFAKAVHMSNDRQNFDPAKTTACQYTGATIRSEQFTVSTTHISSNWLNPSSSAKGDKTSNLAENVTPGLDIGYVPAGPHAFLRPSGQFGPPQFIFHWPEWPVFFFCVLRMPPLFLLGIGKTRKATLIRTYFSLYIYRPNVQKFATSRVKS